jgi:hypothetical protein
LAPYSIVVLLVDTIWPDVLPEGLQWTVLEYMAPHSYAVLLIDTIWPDVIPEGLQWAVVEYMAPYSIVVLLVDTIWPDVLPGLHAVGSLVVHGPLSSVLCCKSIGRCHLFGTCGIGGAASYCARFGV